MDLIQQSHDIEVDQKIKKNSTHKPLKKNAELAAMERHYEVATWYNVDYTRLVLIQWRCLIKIVWGEIR